MVDAIVECVFAQHPHLSRRAGQQDAGARLPADLRRVTADQDRLLTVAAAELRALPDTGDTELRADLDTAMRFLEHERFRVEDLGQTHLRPLEVLAEADLSLLPQLPAFLGQATRALPDRLPAGERLRALGLARARVAALDEQDGAQPGEPGRAAAAAFARYARALADTPPTPGLLGPELLARYLQVAEGVETPVDELLEEASEEVGAARAALERRRETRVLLRSLPRVASVPVELAATISRLREFWEALDVVSVRVDTPLDVRMASRRSPDLAVEFEVSPPLAPGRHPHVLSIPADAAAAEFLNAPTLEMIAVHEVFAGHYIAAEAAARGPSMLRTCVPWVVGLTEGWAHYVEELAVEHDLADGRPLVEVAQLVSRLDSAVRLLGWLSVHMRRWTFTEAMEQSARLGDWPAGRAAREILAVASDPSAAMYTLGRLRIRRWRRAVAPRDRRNLRDFHDRLVRCGSAPLSTAIRYAQVRSGSPPDVRTEVA